MNTKNQYVVRIYYHSYVEKVVESDSEENAYKEALRLLEQNPEQEMFNINLIEESHDIFQLLTH